VYILEPPPGTKYQKGKREKRGKSEGIKEKRQKTKEKKKLKGAKIKPTRVCEE
jgi:hypothetical protein